MARSLGKFLVVLLVVACTPTPSPTAVPTAPPTAVPTAPPTASPNAAAELIVTGSGNRCGPWWMGCGAVLVIEQPGWSLPADWMPGDDDVHFAVDLRLGTEKPSRVTGVMQSGMERIEPGDYVLIGVLTMQSDSPPDSPLESSVGCSVEVSIPPGTVSVTVDVKFRGGCTLAVSMDPATPAPSSSAR